MRATFTAIGLILALSAARSAADALPFNGTLSVNVGVFLPVATTGSGTGTSVGPAGGAATIPSGVFSFNVGAVISPPLVGLPGVALCKPGFALQTQLTIPSFTDACGAGNHATNDALNWTGTTGTGGLSGSVYLTNSLFQTLDGEIPLSVVGNGGTLSGGLIFNLIQLTIEGNPWTTAAVTSTGVLSTRGPSGDVTMVLTAAGFDNRDASGQGTLQLVTPALVTMTGALSGTIPVIADMTLDFVPEPSTALLLGSGIAGLVVLGRRRLAGD